MACGGLARAVSLRFVYRSAMTRTPLGYGKSRLDPPRVSFRERDRCLRVKNSMKPSRLYPSPEARRSTSFALDLAPTQPHNVEVLAQATRRRSDVYLLTYLRQGEGTHSERTTTPRHERLAHARAATRRPRGAAGRVFAGKIKTILTIAIKPQYYQATVCSFTIARCTTVEIACDVHVVRSSVSVVCLSVCLF